MLIFQLMHLFLSAHFSIIQRLIKSEPGERRPLVWSKPWVPPPPPPLRKLSAVADWRDAFQSLEHWSLTKASYTSGTVDFTGLMMPESTSWHKRTLLKKKQGHKRGRCEIRKIWFDLSWNAQDGPRFRQFENSGLYARISAVQYMLWRRTKCFAQVRQAIAQIVAAETGFAEMWRSLA